MTDVHKIELPLAATNFIVCADLHLTSNPNDEYRWELFRYLKSVSKKYDIDTIFISGDISDFKDNHPSVYVNRLTDALADLAKQVQVVIISGNHDYTDPKVPFVSYLKHIPNVWSIVEPTIVDECIMCLPHTRTPEEDWDQIDFAKYAENAKPDKLTILCHQPVIGSKTSDFYEITHGLDSKYFSKRYPKESKDWKVFAGDIHIRQKVGDFQYVGAPYQVRFGDTVEGTVYMALYDDDHFEWKVLFTPFPKKVNITIESADDLEDVLEAVRTEAKKRKCKDMVRVSIKTANDEGLAQVKEAVEQALAECSDIDYKGCRVVKKKVAEDDSDLFEDDDPAPTVLSEEQAVIEYSKRHDVSDKRLAVGMKFIN